MMAGRYPFQPMIPPTDHLTQKVNLWPGVAPYADGRVATVRSALCAEP